MFYCNINQPRCGHNIESGIPSASKLLLAKYLQSFLHQRHPERNAR